ncbi:unnamed protein product [Rhizoctonia solani]|uniref:Uncharacterized protein n=1 Tax=Rhizoctonia solani TaxID=456999 RepID=A0A8H3BI03_9AGAM|nr:unnamed protein product [Rhizoctonia solani]
MFAKFRLGTTLVAITDFCHAGNVYHLRFQLSVCSDGSAFWQEAEEWSNDSKLDQKNKIRAPIIHIAGSSRSEQAYETGRKGGYFTHSLTNLGNVSLTLPQLLFKLQELVDVSLNVAKNHATSPLYADATQSLQIFSNRMWPLDDPEILLRILGVVKAAPSA